jgi:hypothetical protein
MVVVDILRRVDAVFVSVTDDFPLDAVTVLGTVLESVAPDFMTGFVLLVLECPLPPYLISKTAPSGKPSSPQTCAAKEKTEPSKHSDDVKSGNDSNKPQTSSNTIKDL